MEENPARARWRLVKRRIFDGSFFLFTQEVSLDSQPLDSINEPMSPFQPLRQARMRQSVSFNQIVSNANDMVSRLNHGRGLETMRSKARHEQEHDFREDDRDTITVQPLRRLADMHTTRAIKSENLISSYTEHLDRKAASRMSTFMSENVKALRRLSRIPLDLNPVTLQHAMSVYGGSNHGGSNHGDPNHNGPNRGGPSHVGSSSQPPRRLARSLSGATISSRASSRERSIPVQVESVRLEDISSTRSRHMHAEGATPRLTSAREISPASSSLLRHPHRKLSVSSAGSDAMSRGLEALKKRYVAT